MNSASLHHAALAPGYRLHWYEIEQILGQGGFGITYLAKDLNLEQKVAIKEFLPTELAVRTENSRVEPMSENHSDTFSWGLSRFITEAKTLAKFTHPNIVSVLSVFEANNTAYMVMAYVDGQTLEEALKFQRIENESQLLSMTLQLLDGLSQIHAAGFIHRDIKPANIFVKEDQTPVLLDFGSARQALGGQTRTLTALVSPGYAPFEQYGASKEKDNQGPWSDIYALGATLYRAVVGRGPIDAIARANALMSGKPDLLLPASELGADNFSPHFLESIDWALQFLPENRPQSVEQWRPMLEGKQPVPVPQEAATLIAPTRNATDGESAGITNKPRPRITKPWWIAALAGVLLAAALGWFLFESPVSNTDVGAVAPATPTTTDDELTALQTQVAEKEEALAVLEAQAENHRQQLALQAEIDRLTEQNRLAAEAERVAQERRLAEEAARIVEEKRLAEEAARTAEEKRLAEEAARIAEDKRLAEEAARIAEEKRLAEEAARIAEEKRLAEEAARIAEEKRLAEEAARIAEEERLAEEAARIAEEERLAEAQALAEQPTDSQQATQDSVESASTELQITPSIVDALLSEADADLAALRLTSPASNNAYEKYQKVLSMAPDNVRAQQGLKNIVRAYARLFEQAIAKRDLSKAERYLDSAMRVAPQAPALVRAKLKLEQAKTAQVPDNTVAAIKPQETQTTVTKSTNEATAASIIRLLTKQQTPLQIGNNKIDYGLDRGVNQVANRKFVGDSHSFQFQLETPPSNGGVLEIETVDVTSESSCYQYVSLNGRSIRFKDDGTNGVNRFKFDSTDFRQGANRVTVTSKECQDEVVVVNDFVLLRAQVRLK